MPKCETSQHRLRYRCPLIAPSIMIVSVDALLFPSFVFRSSFAVRMDKIRIVYDELLHPGLTDGR